MRYACVFNVQRMGIRLASWSNHLRKSCAAGHGNALPKDAASLTASCNGRKPVSSSVIHSSQPDEPAAPIR